MEMFGSQKLIFRDSRCTDEKATAKLWAKRLTAYHRLHLKHPSVRESGKAAKTKNLTKIWTGIWRRQGQTVENSKNGGEQKGRRWVVKNRLEPLQNFVGSEVAWSSKRLCYHVCVETSFYKRFAPTHCLLSGGKLSSGAIIRTKLRIRNGIWKLRARKSALA